MILNNLIMLFQNNPLGFPDWYFTMLGGAPSPNYEAIIVMQEKMYGASKVVFLIAFVAAIGLYSMQSLFSTKVSPKDLALSVFLTIFVMISYNQIFTSVIQVSVAVGDTISSREEKENWAVEIRKRSDERTGNDEKSSWSYFSGLLGQAVSITLGGGPIAIGAIMIACAGAIFLIAMGVIWALWVILVIILFAFGPLLVSLGVVPNWGTRIQMAWFNALVMLGIWNVYNSMCVWLMTTTTALFIDATGVTDPSAFSGGRLLTTGGMTVVYTLILIAGPILVNALIPLGSFLGVGSFGMEKAASTAVGAVSGGASGLGSAFGGSGGGSTSAGNVKGGGFERNPTKPEGE